MILFTVAEKQLACEWRGARREGCIRGQRYNETIMHDTSNQHV